MAAKKGGLGKGLEALFVDNATEQGAQVVTLKVSEIEPNRNQPRRDFDEEALAELAESIAQHGILQPLLVRPLANGDGYQLVAGERRWRASRMAGLTEVPVVVREMSDTEMMELALIENLQREDLNPMEEALGYQSLMDTYGMTQDVVSKRVGKSRPAVANALRLLNLPNEVAVMVSSGRLSSGHARALLAFPTEKDMLAAAKLAVQKELSVRELENMAKKAKEEALGKKKGQKARDSFFDEVELALNENMGRKVVVQNKGKEKGVLTIEFYSKEDLKTIANLLGE